jgi:ammonia channel protein AmtB
MGRVSGVLVITPIADSNKRRTAITVGLSAGLVVVCRN